MVIRVLDTCTINVNIVDLLVNDWPYVVVLELACIEVRLARLRTDCFKSRR